MVLVCFNTKKSNGFVFLRCYGVVHFNFQAPFVGRCQYSSVVLNIDQLKPASIDDVFDADVTQHPNVSLVMLY